MVQIDGQWEVLSIVERRFARFWLLGYLVTVKNGHEETLTMKVPMIHGHQERFNDWVDFLVRKELAVLKKSQRLETKPAPADYRQAVGMKVQYDPTISDWLAH